MVNLLVVILEQRSKLPELLEAWQEAGVPGVTIMPCAGAIRARSWLSMLGLAGIDRMFESAVLPQRMLLAAIDDDEALARAEAAAERIVGDFDQPNSGLLMVIPLARVSGLHKPRIARPIPRPMAGLAPAVAPNWTVTRDTLVEVVVRVLDLDPTIVELDAPLEKVARAMLNQPAVHVACVVDGDRRLVGLIDLAGLADDLFFHILPEEFLSEITDLEQALRFADVSRIHTAVDAMTAPVSIRSNETVKDAFRRMHDSRLPGLPVIDDARHVVGYINLLELLAVCTNDQPGPVAGSDST